MAFRHMSRHFICHLKQFERFPAAKTSIVKLSKKNVLYINQSFVRHLADSSLKDDVDSQQKVMNESNHISNHQNVSSTVSTSDTRLTGFTDIENNNKMCSSTDTGALNYGGGVDTLKEDLFEVSNESVDVETLQPLAKHVMKSRHHLADYVSQSKTLSQLVRLGVDLTAVQRVRGAANKIIKLDFENQVKPYLYFLHDIGVSDEDMGKYISKNPLIFNVQLDDLQTRVNYLESKKFSKEDIARIVLKAHVFLLMPVQNVDAKLGYLQKEYKLTGNDVRSVVTRLPKLIIWNLQKLKDNRFYLKEFLGFSDAELQTLMISCPKLFLTNRYSLGKKFDYLYTTMGLDHKTLLQWPKVLLTRLHIIQQRHRFLLSVDRAQYMSQKENYVSLQALVSGTDKDFCWNVAKVSVHQYNNFLKSI